MTNLLHPGVSPSPGAYGASPLDAVEIDEHVDADRIWATVVAMREEHAREVEPLQETIRRIHDDNGIDANEVIVNTDNVRNAFEAFDKSKSAKDYEALRHVIFGE